MKKIDYTNNIVGISNSILRYFGLSTLNESDSLVDEYLKENQPENIILILCDGLGYNYLNNNFNKDLFMIKNQIKSLSSVFPTTTVAATTSVLTGLYPNQHCWLGWDNYISEIDKVITMFLNKEKDTDNYLKVPDYCKKIFPYKTILDYINESDIAKSFFVSPYADIKYNNFEDMCNKIKSICDKSGKKFIYAYYENPDALMHKYGLNSQEVDENILMIDNEVEKLNNMLKESVVMIIADHGLTNNKYIYIEDDKELFDCLAHTTSIDSRAAMMFLKKDMKEKFLSIFEKKYGNDFILISRKDIIENKLFGIGNNHEKFESCLGDYIAISISNVSLKYKRIGHKLLANHSGLTSDEVDVPLILTKTR